MGPTKGRLLKLDIPSAKFWVKIFFGWVGLEANTLAPFINKACSSGRGVWTSSHR